MYMNCNASAIRSALSSLKGKKVVVSNGVGTVSCGPMKSKILRGGRENGNTGEGVD